MWASGSQLWRGQTGSFTANATRKNANTIAAPGTTISHGKFTSGTIVEAPANLVCDSDDPKLWYRHHRQCVHGTGQIDGEDADEHECAAREGEEHELHRRVAWTA